MTRTRTTRYLTMLSVVIALALTAALAACGSDEPSGVTGPDGTASTPTETPTSPAQTPTTTESGDAPTATDVPTPAAATALPAASSSVETDREALVALYNATDGQNWIVNHNWLTVTLIGNRYGVTADPEGRVVDLDLSGNRLSGEIPSELGSLFNLELLSFYSNQLSGEIPPELGNLVNLDTLWLEGNQLSGCVPASLSLQRKPAPDLPDC